MEMTNDQVFDFIFEEEFNKIPYLFRFSRRRVKIAAIVLGVLVLGMCVTTTVLESMNGVTAVIIAAVLTAIVAGWMSLAIAFEKRAFAKASEFTYKYSISERERSNSKVNLIKAKSF